MQIQCLKIQEEEHHTMWLELLKLMVSCMVRPVLRLFARSERCWLSMLHAIVRLLVLCCCSPSLFLLPSSSLTLLLPSHSSFSHTPPSLTLLLLSYSLPPTPSFFFSGTLLLHHVDCTGHATPEVRNFSLFWTILFLVLTDF